MTIDIAALRARLENRRPHIAIVLGSGLGGLADAAADAVRVPYADIPGWPRSGVSGHGGTLVAGRIGGVEALVLSGRVHAYETGNASAMRPALEAVAALGVDRVLLTNAAGSLRETMSPGSAMLIEDHLNLSGMNPLHGEPSDRRFVGMTETYDVKLRAALSQAAEAEGEALHRGVYAWFSGPSFETPAEICMARLLGADAVGMSTVPEAILCRFLGLRVAAASVITNYGAGMTGAELSHAETKAVAPRGGRVLARILQRALPALAAA